MREVYDFLKKAETFYLATIDGNSARVRPFGAVDLFEGRMYFQTGRKKAVYRQMKACPEVEVCAMLDGRWIRISGTAVEDNRLEPNVHMLESYPSLKEMYAPGDGNCTVFYLKDATAVISSFTEPSEVVKF
ncbi:pyridoxamine 5'-phosphate oxidase family protein [Eubacteriales bacterium mix99]|jgi:uncharacterized pyridoxamine 5'-phosphate oxidase family protein